MAEQQMNGDIGTKACISVEAIEGAINVAVDFKGNPLKGGPSVVQSLALVGLQAIREAAREYLDVAGEEVTAGESTKFTEN